VDDLTAIRQLKRGNLEALGVLVKRYQVEAARAAYLVTGDAVLAEDVMQDSFLRFYCYIEGYDESRPFAPYFMRIVANNAARAVRQRSREIPTEVNDLDTFIAHLPDDFDLKEQVMAALDQLSPEQRAVVVLRYYFDYSEQEMSETLSTPQGTISWRLHSARKKLGVMLRGFNNG
jgi:RNA polymerase sigma-70 factor, ECF subfamily